MEDNAVLSISIDIGFFFFVFSLFFNLSYVCFSFVFELQ